MWQQPNVSTPQTKLYPTVSTQQDVGPPDHSFRLARISEIDAYLRREIEDRRKMRRKYKRAVKAAQGTGDAVGVLGLGMESGGIVLMATGIGIIPGIVLATVGVVAFSVDLMTGLIIRKCTAKASKHASIEMTARSKLNSIHHMISKALIDGTISDEEFKLISDEVDRYQALKEDIRTKSVVTSANATLKNEQLSKTRKEIQAEFSKYIADFDAIQK